MKGIINLESVWRHFLKRIGKYYQWLYWQEKNSPTLKMKKMRALYGEFVHEGDTCFDIGANMGSRVASFLMLKAKVIAVEPQRKCIQELKALFSQDDVVVVPKGVGAINEIKDFYLADDSLISSFSQEWIQGQKSGFFKNNRWDHTEKIEVITIDSLIAEYGVPDFIKIDTEGFELEVLQGLSQPVKALSFEYTLPHQQDKAVECINIINNLYQGKALFNICRDEAYQMKLPEWTGYGQFVEIIKSNGFNQQNFGMYGDIYVKRLVDQAGG